MLTEGVGCHPDGIQAQHEPGLETLQVQGLYSRRLGSGVGDRGDLMAGWCNSHLSQALGQRELDSGLSGSFLAV